MDSSHGKHGVLIGPLYNGKNSDQMAKWVFKLLMTLGLDRSDIARVMINPQAGWAKVEVHEKECEDFLVKVLNQVGYVMCPFDLRRLVKHPEHLKVSRLGQAETSERGTSTLDTASGPDASLPPDTPTVLQTFSHELALNISQNSRPNSSDMPSALKGEKPRPNQNKAASTSDIPTSSSGSEPKDKPGMFSIKTSTQGVYPCGCPDTVFYHRFQHIGSETRYSEFKKGGVIGDYRAFRFLVGKYVCGFLNSEGGTIYFGVLDDGTVLGIDVDERLEDRLRYEIFYAIRLIEPQVDDSEYTVNFARVKENNEFSPDKKVLEICVKPRQPQSKRYFYKETSYLRRDGSLNTLPRPNYWDY